MKELVVISGKGGTGKTSITAAFAALARNAVLADCDVDAADLHLVLGPRVLETQDFVGGKRARINPAECNGCGTCADVCRFEAVRRTEGADALDGRYVIDAIACEGCGVCAAYCPRRAIAFEDCVNGRWYISQTRFGPMVHAELGIAEENSGKLVTLIRREARRIAEEQGKELLIVDGSPGIGCPVIASITGADAVLVVTEPTLSGRHDLGRVAQLAAHLRVRAMVCINKADLNAEIAQEIERDAKERGIAAAGRIRYTDAFTKAQMRQCSIVECDDGPAAEDTRNLWSKVSNGF